MTPRLQVLYLPDDRFALVLDRADDAVQEQIPARIEGLTTDLGACALLVFPFEVDVL